MLKSFLTIMAFSIGAISITHATEKSDEPIGVQVKAKTSTQIGAPMSGQIIQFPFKDGDRFTQGDTLAKFQCAQQEATLMHAKANVEKRSHMLKTQQKLKDLGTWSTVEYQTAAAELNAAKADLTLANVNVNFCTVKAPFSGRVANTMVENWGFVGVGAPILEILNDAELELEMLLPSKWLAWVKTGTPFRISVSENKGEYDAEINRISGKVDAVSQTVKVYGKITGKDVSLLPGMSGTAQFSQP